MREMRRGWNRKRGRVEGRERGINAKKEERRRRMVKNRKRGERGREGEENKRQGRGEKDYKE